MEYIAEVLMTVYQTIVEKRGYRFRPTEELIKNIEAVARFMTGDTPRFGLLLCGDCGNGKTTLVYAIQKAILILLNDEYSVDFTYNLSSMSIVYAPQLTETYTENRNKWNEIVKSPMLAIDDVGVEPVESFFYGNACRPMEDLLSRRYNMRLSTIMTSNLSPHQLGERYGRRLHERLREMMTVIPFAGDSFR